MLGFISIFIFGYLASRYFQTHDRKVRSQASRKIKRHALLKSYSFVKKVIAEKSNSARKTKETSSQNHKRSKPLHQSHFDNSTTLQELDGSDNLEMNPIYEESIINDLDSVKAPIFLLRLSPWGGTQTPEEYK